MTKENPLPTTYDNDEEMANAFADYFMDKIKGIWNSLEHHPIYQPKNSRCIKNRLIEFNEISEEYTKNTISRMTTKSCELDPLPIDIFKKAIENEKFLQEITRKINHSLNRGQYMEDRYNKAIA